MLFNVRRQQKDLSRGRLKCLHSATLRQIRATIAPVSACHIMLIPGPVRETNRRQNRTNDLLTRSCTLYRLSSTPPPLSLSLSLSLLSFFLSLLSLALYLSPSPSKTFLSVYHSPSLSLPVCLSLCLSLPLGIPHV